MQLILSLPQSYCILVDEQQAQSNSMEQDIETSREGNAAPLAGNVSVEPHADDSDDSL